MNIHLSDQPFTQRQLRVGELLKQLLGNLFLKEEVALPNINTRVITVSEVRMSPDLKHAKVFFMPLGGKNSEFSFKFEFDFTEKQIIGLIFLKDFLKLLKLNLSCPKE